MDPCDYLLEMVTSVDQVKAPPRLRGQRAEHGMVEQSGAASEPFFCIAQRGIHGDQRVVKEAQRIVAQPLERHRMLRGFDPCREPANSQNVEAPHALPEIRFSALRLSPASMVRSRPLVVAV